jgi:hypothetical protein
MFISKQGKFFFFMKRLRKKQQAMPTFVRAAVHTTAFLKKPGYFLKYPAWQQDINFAQQVLKMDN